MKFLLICCGDTLFEELGTVTRTKKLKLIVWVICFGFGQCHSILILQLCSRFLKTHLREKGLRLKVQLLKHYCCAARQKKRFPFACVVTV